MAKLILKCPKSPKTVFWPISLPVVCRIVWNLKFKLSSTISFIWVIKSQILRDSMKHFIWVRTRGPVKSWKSYFVSRVNRGTELIKDLMKIRKIRENPGKSGKIRENPGKSGNRKKMVRIDSISKFLYLGFLISI